MSDRQTGSVWTHFDGNVLTGPMTGTQLEVIATSHTEWADWLDRHPDTTVLDLHTGYEDRYREIQIGRGGLGPQFQQTILNWDTRLAENELVLGVDSGQGTKAYVLESLSGTGVLADQIGGIAVVVFYNAESLFALAFSPTVDHQMLTFFVEGDVISDNETGSSWSLEGKALSGPLVGSELPFVTSFVTEWYGWSAYHPETEIYDAR